MATATINIEFMAGDDIKSAFEEAIRIAKLMNVNIEFKFNGVHCYAYSSSTAEKGVKTYSEAVSKDKPKMALAL